MIDEIGAGGGAERAFIDRAEIAHEVRRKLDMQTIFGAEEWELLDVGGQRRRRRHGFVRLLEAIARGSYSGPTGIGDIEAFVRALRFLRVL